MPSPFCLPIDHGDLKSGTEETGWEVDDDEILKTSEQLSLGQETGAEASSPEVVEEQGEMLVPMSQIEPSLEWQETVFEDAEDFLQALPKSESQDTQWEEQSTDSDEEDDEEEFTPDSGRRRKEDATLLPMDKVIDFLSDIPRLSFTSSLLKSVTVGVKSFGMGPSKRFKFTPQQSIKPANNHNCPSQQGLAKQSGGQVNLECNFQYTTASSGSYLMVSCASCLKRIVKLQVGDIIRVENTLGLIRSLGPHKKTLHIQQLSTELTLHTGPHAVTLSLLDPTKDTKGGSKHQRRTVMLTKAYQDISIPELNSAWVKGRVDWWPQSKSNPPRIMFCRASTTCDVESVDMGCSRRTGCCCLNPWAPEMLDIQPGDLVELAPEGPSEQVDVLTRLGRVQEWSSGEVRRMLVGLRSSKEEERSRLVPRDKVLRVLDPQIDLPPGVSLLEDDADDAASPGDHQTPQPLDCIDLFCGMGGLSLGLESTGIAEVKYGVDGFYAATQTFRAAHPSATVLCQDVCQFLKELESKGSAKGLKLQKKDEEGGPRRLLIGGPPCQGFSGANKAGKGTKLEKNVCMALFLQGVVQLEPDYVIIENVKGLLRAEGVVESIIQCLVSLGYQTRVRVVNAGSFGVAQQRVRVIVTAAADGLPLPQPPRPTHVFHAGGYDEERPQAPCSLAQRNRYAVSGVPLRWQPCVIVPTCALLPRVTVRNVIGDLPAEEGEDLLYNGPPASAFQAAMRLGSADTDCIEDHVSSISSFSDVTVARIGAVPRESDPPGPGRVLVCQHPQRPPVSGDWRDIPEELLPDELRDPAARTNPKKLGRYGRLMWDKSHFSTLLTRSCIALNSETTGPVLHPDADRPLTLREAARVQGIPDWVKIWRSTLEEGYRQCGNGVPTPLASAMGRELKRAVSHYWRKVAS